MLLIFNALLFFILGGFVGKFMAMTAFYLPQILLEGCDKGREPRDIIGWFFQKPHCWHCQHTYSRKENAPIAGYFSLKGICPYCHKPFGKRVLFLELGMGLFFSGSTLLFPVGVPLVFFLLISALLILCFITDYEHGILPDQFTLGLVWVGLLGSLYPVSINSQDAIIGAAGGYGFFWAFNVIYRYFRGFDGMYPGDFKLNAGIGSIVGWKLLIPVILASLCSLVILTVLQALYKRDAGSETKLLYKEIPYACFTSVVTMAVLIWLFSNTMVPAVFFGGNAV